METHRPMRDSFLVFGSPLIEPDEIADVVSCLESRWIGTGPRVARFEQDFKAYKNAPYAVAVNSCTAALHLSILAAGVQPGDEVITTPMTFCATANAIIHAGGVPVLVDIDPVTLNLDVSRIEAKITSKTRAIVPVHFAGRCCDMQELVAIASRHGLKIIEDCAHAIETEQDGQKAGCFGDFGCFSFYVTKNLTTGEGGMVLTKSEEDAARIKTLALHGMTKDAWKRFGDSGYKHYQVEEAGFKYNLTDVQAALGIRQLQKVQPRWLRRQAVWNRYMDAFAGLPLTLPASPAPGSTHAYHLFTPLIDEARAGISRDSFLDAMTARRIGVGVHYLSVPEHPFYQRTFGWKPEDYPAAMKVGRQTVSLPLSAALTDDDVEDVVHAVKSILG